MTDIKLPKVPQYVEESELREAFQDYGREVARVVLEAAAKVCEIANVGASYRIRDSLAGRIRALEIKHD